MVYRFRNSGLIAISFEEGDAMSKETNMPPYGLYAIALAISGGFRDLAGATGRGGSDAETSSVLLLCILTAVIVHTAVAVWLKFRKRKSDGN
jgi:hypothetical protein